jgi:DNA invertase Pin-like site-specific DNA recombinase
VQSLTAKDVKVQFIKENLTFTGEDSPIANLTLSIMGAFAEFERALIRERQLEGIALAKKRGVYKGRQPSLSPEQVEDIKHRIGNGEKKSHVAKHFGISRETLYKYLKSLTNGDSKV